MSAINREEMFARAMAERKKSSEDQSRRAAARQVRLMCKDCQNPEVNIVEETANGDLVCGDCGLILGDRVVDTRSEWRTFASDDGPDQSRVGSGPTGDALLSGVEDFSTGIGFQDNHTGYANELQRAQSRMVGAKTSSNREAGFDLIKSYCDAMGITGTVADAAKMIFATCENNIEKALKEHGTRLSYGKGANALASVAATCVFIACKEQKVARSMKEVWETCQVSKKDLGNSYKLVSRMLKAQMVSGQRSSEAYQDLGVHGGRAESTASQLLPRLCHQLNLPMRMETAARYIINKAGENGQGVVDGRSPTSVAAGALYFTCLLFEVEMGVKDVALEAQVSEATVRLIATILAKFRDTLIDPKWVGNGKFNVENVAHLVRKKDGTDKASVAGITSGTIGGKVEPSLEMVIA